MRNIDKLEEPTILAQFGQQWTAELLAAQPRTDQFREIESRYRNPAIKNRLREELHLKCAYCESKIEAVAYAHIEHVLPKTLHRELTFAWENLTLACPVCNTQKGDIDPTPNNFVNPYTDNPEERFSFVGPVMSPAPNDIAALNMINWLDLNRPELVISRSEIVQRIIDIYREAARLPLEARREFLNLALGPLTHISHRHSRVAKCTADVLEQLYAEVLAA